MKTLLESFRTYSLDENETLLIEGRIDDVKAKYPELAKKREELDGESLLDVLIEADPSGNQKYLMGAARILQRSMENAEQANGYEPFWGKHWPEDADDNLYSPWGVGKNIAGLLPKYHGLMAYIRDQDAPFKDINNIKNYAALQAVVKTAQSKKDRREQEKKEKAELKRTAREESEVIADTPYHLVVRPLSRVASCYYGRDTKWCISATKSENYFDHYTSQGQAFLFLLAKKEGIEKDWRKIAVVMDREGTFDQFFNAADDSMYLREFERAILQTIVGLEVSDQIASYDAEEPYDKDVIIKGLEPFKGESGFDFDEGDRLKDIISLFNNTVVADYIDMLEERGRESTQDTPAGIPDEAYEEMLADYDFDNFYVQLHFPDETGLDHIYWDASVGVDLDNLLARAQGWELTTDDWDEWDEETLRDLVETIFTDANIWVIELEQDYGDPAVFNARIEGGSGDLDQFEDFLRDVDTDDDNINTEMVNAFIEHASEVDPPIIRNPEKEEAEKEAARQLTRDAEYWPDPEEKKKQTQLPLQENRFRIKIVKNK
jgi:hypothetical protein